MMQITSLETKPAQKYPIVLTKVYCLHVRVIIYRLLCGAGEFLKLATLFYHIFCRVNGHRLINQD